jgi:hypothetical protein
VRTVSQEGPAERLVLSWFTLGRPLRTMVVLGVLAAAMVALRQIRLRLLDGVPLMFEDELPSDCICSVCRRIEAIGLGPAKVRRYVLTKPDTTYGRSGLGSACPRQSARRLLASRLKHSVPGTPVDGPRRRPSSAMPEDLPAPHRPLPFLFQSTGIETRFTNRFDPEPRSRDVSGFLKPDALAESLPACDAGPRRDERHPHPRRQVDVIRD